MRWPDDLTPYDFLGPCEPRQDRREAREPNASPRQVVGDPKARAEALAAALASLGVR